MATHLNMLTVDEIIKALGGATAISKDLGLYRNAAHKWKERGIPSKYADWVSQRLGIAVSELPTAAKKSPHLSHLTTPDKLPTASLVGAGAYPRTEMTSLMTYVKELYAPKEQAADLRKRAGELPSWDMSERQLCDIELILNGAFSPLEGFLAEGDYDRVCQEMRLDGGVGPKDALWPMPVTLDVSDDFAEKAEVGQEVALRDGEGVVIAIMTVESKWQPNKSREAEHVFGADDMAHPAVNYLHNTAGNTYLGGKLLGVDRPTHYDFRAERHTPNELRALFDKWGWRRIVAFQTRNPLHRAHQELTLRAAKSANANLLIHPVVGMTKPGDVDHFTRVRCYQAIMDSYPAQTSTMSLLHLAMRMGGPREALWHALIRKNYGVTHFVVGRDHAGPGKNSAGEDFYGPYDAQDMVTEYRDEIGIEMVPFKMMVYVQDRAQYVPVDEVKEGETQLNISGTEVRRRLREDIDIPEWFSPPAVIKELKRAYPPMSERGFTVFFTGLSGSGKSTIANALMTKLMELGGRPVTLLDGDLVRKNLSSELGFSKEHRDLNILRIGYVASEITKNSGIAICAPIAPYAKTRAEVRKNIEQYGQFVEVHVATTLEECEARDRKGLYAMARKGIIKEFTGISDPYEVPENAELVIQTADVSPDSCAHQVMLKLEGLGLI